MESKHAKAQIIMMASAHSAFDTRIFHKEAVFLDRNGFHVTIIVPHQNDVVVDNIAIKAVSIPKNGYEKLLITPFKILFESLRQNSKAVFHIHDAELLIVGLILKALGRKVIYDAHEDTPKQMLYQHWIPKILRKPVAVFYYNLEKFAGRVFDAIIVAEPVLLKYYPPQKTILLRNFPVAEKFLHLKTKLYHQRKNQLVYIGLLSEPRGIHEMAKSVKLAKKQLSFEFVVGGKFAPKSLEESYITNNELTYLSWLSMEEIINVLGEAKVGIIIPNPIERYLTNYPVKMFEYMAAGLPVISSKYGDSSEFVKESNGGLLVDPLDPEDISKAIVWIFNNPDEAEKMGKRAQEMIFLKYSWETESEKLISLYGNSL